MSVRLTKLARAYCQEHQVKGAMRAVLLELADSSRDDGMSWDGQERLAKRTGITAEWVRKCVRELEQMGVVETRKAHKAGSRKRFNVYRLKLPGLAPPDYHRLAHNGITLEAPFTPDEEVDDRNSVAATTGTQSSFSASPSFKGTPKETLNPATAPARGRRSTRRPHEEIDLIELEALVEELDDRDDGTQISFERQFLGVLDARHFRFIRDQLDEWRYSGVGAYGRKEPMKSEAGFVRHALHDLAMRYSDLPREYAEAQS